MNDDRTKKLQDIRAAKKAKKSPPIKTGEDFIQALSLQFKSLEKILDTSIKLDDVDDIVDKLAQVKILSQDVDNLRRAIKDFEIPSRVEITGIRDLINEVKNIKPTVKVDWLNGEHAKAIIQAVQQVSDAVEKNKVPEPGKSPSDFIPVRRVVKIGNTLQFDDSQPTGGSRSGGGVADSTAANQEVEIENLEAIKNAVEIMDDWDESDRAKVNPVVGQAGVAAGAGLVSLSTQRVVIATDQTAIPVIATDLDIRNLSQGQDAILIYGSDDGGTTKRVIKTDSGGAIQVDLEVANVTEANSAAILTAVELIDDIVYTDDTSTHSTGSSKGALFMAAATPTDTSVNANDIGAVAMTIDRKLHVSVQDSLPAGSAAIGKLAANDGVDIGDVTINNSTGGSAVNIQDGGNSITVDYATTGSGNATGALRVELPTNGTGVIATVGAVTAITNALPAGNNNIGDVDVASIAAGDNNIGNVDVVTVPSDPFGANADAAATAGGTGSIQAKLRNLTSTSDASATSLGLLDNSVDGNYLNVNMNIAGTDVNSGSGTSTGALRVELPTNGTGVIATVGAVTSITNAVTVNSHNVTNAGTFAVQVDGVALTALQLIDDIVYTDDTSTHTTGSSKGAGIMAVASPSDASVDTNDIGMLAMTNARALKNDITTIAGTAPTTAGFIDIKGADGNVFVRQATASNLNMTEASAASILTSVQLIDDMIYTDDTSTHSTGSSKGALIMGAATPTDTAVNANDIGAIGMTNNRELYVSLRDIAGTTATTGSGTATGALRVELANNGTGVMTSIGSITSSVVPGTAATNLGKAVDSATGSTDTGVATLMKRVDTPTTVTPAANDYMNTHGDKYGNTYVAQGAFEVGTLFNNILDDVDISVKASAGYLKSIRVTSINAGIRYLQIHNKATAPVNPDVPLLSFPIPAGSATNPVAVSFGQDDWGMAGLSCTVGIAIGISTTAATFTAATTTDHVVTGLYV